MCWTIKKFTLVIHLPRWVFSDNHNLKTNKKLLRVCRFSSERSFNVWPGKFDYCFDIKVKVTTKNCIMTINISYRNQRKHVRLMCNKFSLRIVQNKPISRSASSDRHSFNCPYIFFHLRLYRLFLKGGYHISFSLDIHHTCKFWKHMIFS